MPEKPQEAPRGFTPYELDIADRMHKFQGGAASQRKGIWIREHLKVQHQDYPYGMFKRYSAFAKAAGFNPGSYGSFRRYMSLLKTLGLVRPIGEQPGQNFPRRFYGLVPKYIQDEAWLRPFDALYGSRPPQDKGRRRRATATSEPQI